MTAPHDSRGYFIPTRDVALDVPTLVRVRDEIDRLRLRFASDPYRQIEALHAMVEHAIVTARPTEDHPSLRALREEAGRG